MKTLYFAWAILLAMAAAPILVAQNTNWCLAWSDRDFHVFGVEWEPAEIRWYVDGKNYFSTTTKMVRGKWVFDRPFFILLNLAIGGNWPGAPDSTTPFPVKMLVDYVRVYKAA